MSSDFVRCGFGKLHSRNGRCHRLPSGAKRRGFRDDVSLAFLVPRTSRPGHVIGCRVEVCNLDGRWAGK